MKTDNSPPRGTRDLLPGTVARRDQVLATIAGVYRRFGYQRIETPALEDLARLTGGQGGENEKLIFQILRRGLPDRVEAGTDLGSLTDFGLRFDLTVPLTRFYAANHSELPSPFRSFQFGPVWRAERPQRGRYRQFYQCDIDIVGEPSMLAELELIEATTEAMSAVGLTGSTVRISDRRFLSALAAQAGLPEQSWPEFFIGLDKLDKIGWDRVRTDLTENAGLPRTAVDAALGCVQQLEGLPRTKFIDALADALPTLGEEVLDDLTVTVAELGALSENAPWSWSFDPTLVRGPGYYTGQVFEVGHPDFPSSIAGGGRYDNLIGRSLGRDVPACGFSIGFERIIDLLRLTADDDVVAVLYETDVPRTEVLAAARRLREEGRKAAAVPRGGKFAAQLRRLEQWGFSGFVHLKSDAAGASADADADGTRASAVRPLGKEQPAG
ncbi:histidine--tRNA ligase [Streptomyces sp. NPDC001852]|uniref:histidine--tRNA ligase n=1 Tax=Streptomyces sp. NPDC001852 TaxID=3364619 RepID=UPI00367ABA58